MIDRSDNALIVFVKNPVPGQVKTRLAATVGDERALEVYLQLLHHTLSVAAQVNADLIICYSKFVPDSDEWTSLKARRSIQQGENLGECMQNALEVALKSCRRAILIGSDCAEITTEIIDKAFQSLQHVAAVVGPAVDGGYYLVGARKPLPPLFDDIEWSSEHVMFQTLGRLFDAGINFSLGETLRDIDTEQDWKHFLAS